MAIGAMVYQEVDQARHVYGVANAGFSARDERCLNNEQKCPYLVWGIREYIPYLEERYNNKSLT
jgi:hypothetical protein